MSKSLHSSARWQLKLHQLMSVLMSEHAECHLGKTLRRISTYRCHVWTIIMQMRAGLTTYHWSGMHLETKECRIYHISLKAI